ncbi:MAG TPA: methionyl-tRNA formyltransferase, partial [Dehalococcoidia bacterium]|nr:methionyl-tRNA formyltransferase [Dehalococcoidia bacterium]
MSRKLERADGLADWSMTADELERRSRAFTPWPGLFTDWNGSGVKLVEVTALDGDGLPGLVAETGDLAAPVAVGTRRGLLGLKTVQLEGKRAVPTGDFLRGAPSF